MDVRKEGQKEYLRAVRELDARRSEVPRHIPEDGHKVKMIEKELDWRRIVKEAAAKGNTRSELINALNFQILVFLLCDLVHCM